MLDKKETAKKWLDRVFIGIEELERSILYQIEHSSFDDKIIQKHINNLQHHYSAISNLKKSFNDDSFFVGFIE